MKLIIALFLMLVASSCSTPGDVMKSPSTNRLQSSKSVDVVMGCVAPKILSDWGESKISPDEKGQMMVISGSAWADALAIVDVQPSDAGSSIILRRGRTADRVYRSIVSQIRGCTK
jgi:hypothetical protein